MILVIDNYDSFTYNLVHYLRELDYAVIIYRNDEINLEKIKELSPQAILLSPGPSQPRNAGICLNLINEFKSIFPILGICLGHQCIGEAMGGNIIQAKEICHGKFSEISHDGDGVYLGLKKPLKVVRYHSLVVDQQCLPDELLVTATSPDGEIMGIRHRKLPIEGVQFHPESIGSEQGHELLNNFFKNHIK